MHNYPIYLYASNVLVSFVKCCWLILFLFVWCIKLWSQFSHSNERSYCQKIFVIMTVSGLSGSPSRCLRLPPCRLGSQKVRVMAFSVAGIAKRKQETKFLHADRSALLIITCWTWTWYKACAMLNGKWLFNFPRLVISQNNIFVS